MRVRRSYQSAIRNTEIVGHISPDEIGDSVTDAAIRVTAFNGSLGDEAEYWNVNPTRAEMELTRMENTP